MVREHVNDFSTKLNVSVKFSKQVAQLELIATSSVRPIKYSIKKVVCAT